MCARRVLDGVIERALAPLSESFLRALSPRRPEHRACRPVAGLRFRHLNLLLTQRLGFAGDMRVVGYDQAQIPPKATRRRLRSLRRHSVADGRGAQQVDKLAVAPPWRRQRIPAARRQVSGSPTKASRLSSESKLRSATSTTRRIDGKRSSTVLSVGSKVGDSAVLPRQTPRDRSARGSRRFARRRA